MVRVFGPVTATYRYGNHPAQVVDLHLPGDAAHRVAVLLHGGYWRGVYDRTLERGIAADLTGHGWAVWNVDYRAVRPGHHDGGGWPHTFLDVAAAVDLLTDAAAEHALLVQRTVVVGHSAGRTLALWAAARHRLQAAICDLVDGARQHLGSNAIRDLMEGGDYALASPAALLPLGVPVYVVTSAQDDPVPPEQSTRFVAAAQAAGDAVTLEVVPGEDHLAHLDPASTCWQLTRAWLDQF
jgi:acetyl esterase/lipase